jgi:hypothetical protein
MAKIGFEMFRFGETTSHKKGQRFTDDSSREMDLEISAGQMRHHSGDLVASLDFIFPNSVDRPPSSTQLKHRCR